jgi:2-hydroxy-6-oxonona-2,4-dienedioate hydrolase
MQAQFRNIGGVTTRLLTAGSGPALILIHAVGLSADTWCRNIDALAKHHTVIAPDLLGHGFTSAVPYTHSPQQHAAQHVLDVARSLELDQFSLAGSSFGGLIAALIALEHAPRVRKLIIIGSGSVFHAAETRERSLRATFANGSKVMLEPSVAACRDRLANICFARSAVPEEILLTQATAYAQPDRLEAYRASIDGAIASAADETAQVIDRLEQIGRPTLVIAGREDIRVSVEQTAAGTRRMPDARLKIYEQCGHLPYLEHPERFNQDVAEFLR